MDRDVQAAGALDGHRRVRLRELGQRCMVVEIFVAIPLAGRCPPGRGRLEDVEFRQFIDDVDLVQGGLVRELVAEAQAVVVDAKHHVESAMRLVIIEQRNAQFVVVIAHEAPFAPGLLPGLVETARGLAGERETALEFPCVREDKPQAGFADNRRAVARDGVAGPALAVEGHPQPKHLARRVDAGDFCRRGQRGRQQRHDADQASHLVNHGVAPAAQMTKSRGCSRTG